MPVDDAYLCHLDLQNDLIDVKLVLSLFDLFYRKPEVVEY